MYGHDESGAVDTDIVEGRHMSVDCTSPATVPDDDVSLTMYKDAHNMGCYSSFNAAGVYVVKYISSISKEVT